MRNDVEEHSCIELIGSNSPFEKLGVEPSIEVGAAQVQHGIDVFWMPPRTRQLETSIDLLDGAFHGATADG